MDIKSEMKTEDNVLGSTGSLALVAVEDSKPDIKGASGKTVAKYASQIIQEQSGRAMPLMRKGISRRVYPLISLNPYEGNWTIRVRVTSKSPMRTYSNARGQGNVFNVELTDEEGTQILAVLFKEAADKFFDKLQMGKLYYISKGSLRAANKRFSTLNNDYEMYLTQTSEVEEIPEAEDSPSKIPLVKYSFVKIDELGPYVNRRELIDVIGVVQSVGSNISIRRKSNNEEIPKREITVADQSGKTVVISLWNDLATGIGADILDKANDAPVVSVRLLRAGDYQGVSLSTTGRSVVEINPEIPEAQVLRKWYDADGKTASFAPAGASLIGGTVGTTRQTLPAERSNLADASRPEVGEDKPARFTVRACISFIKPDQPMWYLACATCNRKVIEEFGSSYRCEACQKSYETCNRRYIMSCKASDFSGEVWVSTFHEQTEQILGISADELAEIRSQDPDGKEYAHALKKASWVPRMFRISVSQQEYKSEKRQRITVSSVGLVDWAAESKLILEKILSFR